MEPKTVKLSVALAVYNESENLVACLESIKDIASEIVLVDGQSTDNTVEIGKKYGAKILVEENRSNFHINKQHAVDACQGEWVLQLDADERVSSMLAKEIVNTIMGDTTGKPSTYYLKRRNYFLGRWLNKGGAYPDPVIRLFKKGAFTIPQNNVHEVVHPQGAGWLNEDLLHIADPNFARYLLRSNRYTTLQAQEWLKEGKLGTDWGTCLLYMIAKPAVRFGEIYLRHRGYVDGFPGFVFAWYSGLHIASSYVKYWENKQSGRTT